MSKPIDFDATARIGYGPDRVHYVQWSSDYPICNSTRYPLGGVEIVALRQAEARVTCRRCLQAIKWRAPSTGGTTE